MSRDPIKNPLSHFMSSLYTQPKFPANILAIDPFNTPLFQILKINIYYETIFYRNTEFILMYITAIYKMYNFPSLLCMNNNA